MNPEYPIYIISKGRAESRLTSKSLEAMRVPYRIVIEPQEYAEYSSVICRSKILTLPFSNLGQGSIPARNWVLDHARASGVRRHWIMDDNISGFARLQNNMKIKVASGTILKAAEDFVDRYVNVPIAGLQYDYFAKRKFGSRLPPFALNTRVYSCLLIDNTIKHRWRGRYNEDTDLCLRVLKDGDCTILFYAFLQLKVPTMQMAGGNTDTIYNTGDNRREFAESLVDQHPDVARLTQKFGRWHHHVDYSQFRRNQLIRRPGCTIKQGVNEYGLLLKTVRAVDSVTIPVDSTANQITAEHPTEQESLFI
jgi:hypothetical protein